MRSAAPPAALVFALAIPFHAFWIDAELARRAIGMLAAAVLAVTARVWLPARLDRAGLLLLALAAWHLVRSIGVTNPALGVERGLWWLALWIVFAWGRTARPDDWLNAAVPTGIAVSAFGLLQALGIVRDLHVWLWELDPDPSSWSPVWTWFQGVISYDFVPPGPPQAVSTMLNLNYGSEIAAVSGAAAAVRVIRGGTTRRSSIACVALCMAYVLVNGSLSGILALPLAFVAILLQRGTGQRQRLVLVAAVLAGLAFGLLAILARPGPTTGGEAANVPSQPRAEAPRRAPSTVLTRLLIWESGIAMAEERPLSGHGAGQFQIEYPRYRDPEEIDISSTGVSGPRSYRSLPRTAHNDPLEILIETGVPGLLLWAAFVVLILWSASRHGLAATAPWVALLLLSLVRSPFGNAPVAVLAFGYAGSLRGSDDGRAPWWWCALLVLPAAAWAWCGAHTLMGQTVAAAYQQNLRFASEDFAPVATLSEAIEWAPADSRLRGLRLSERLREVRRTGRPPNPLELDEDMDAIARREPHETGLLLLRARAAQRMQQPARALHLVREVRALDPADPEAALYEATLLMERGDADAAIAALYTDTHPKLRPQLSRRFEELAAEAARLGRPEDEVLAYRAEAAFLNAVDATRSAPGSADALIATRELADLIGALDLRLLVLGAINTPDKARDYGKAALASGLSLSAPQRRMLAGIEEPLLEIPAWRRVLEE